MKTYKSYMFRSKDPAIDEMRTLIQKHYNGTGGDQALRKGMKEIEEEGGPQRGTLRNWFFGQVRRPQSATIEAAGRALGYKRQWVKM